MAENNQDFLGEALQGALQKALSNPKTRKAVLRAMKEAEPEVDIPAVELEDALANVEKNTNERLDELNKRISDDAVARGIMDSRNALRAQKYTDEDITAIEGLMQERHIPDYETAAELFKLRRQVAMPTPPINQRQPAGPVVPEDVMKGGAPAINQHARSEAAKVIDEINAGRAAG